MANPPWERIEPYLDELFDLSESERRARLDALPPEDRDLRPALERLITADAESTDGLLDRGLDSIAGAVFEDEGTPALAPGERVGSFRVLRSIGRGGMGEVVLAERADGEFDQQVALKVMSATRSGTLERFRRERQMLARLRHPNIAALYDGGVTMDGAPYFAMEYVQGERITDWCDRHRLGVKARIEMFESVCRAVQYAHRNLIVHRDLKPSNVLVTEDGVPKLLDFGIGKVLDLDADGEDTQATQRFLTPAFAAPEQIRGEQTSTWSDVFSLGMLLYVLVSGHHPHGDTRRGVEIARAIAEDEAPDPSSRVGQDSTTATADEIAECRGAAPAELRRQLKGDLDNIVRKALQKRPDDRYGSPEELRADLERFRRSLPVHARPATVGYRLRKFGQRHPVGLAAGVGATLALAVGVGGIWWQAQIAERERSRAVAVKDYLTEVFSAVDPTFESGESLSVSELVERGVVRLDDHLADDAGTKAEIQLVLGRVLTRLARFDVADSVLQGALAEYRRLEEPDGIYGALRRLSETASWEGRMDESLALNREALEVAEAAFGETDPRTISALNAIAETLLEESKPEEAEPLIHEVIRRSRIEFGPESVRTAKARAVLGKYYVGVGNFAAAESEIRFAVQKLREHGVDGLEFSAIVGQLGWVLEELGQSAEAEEHLREAVRVLRAEYGEEGHPELAAVLSNLAGPLFQGNRAEASQKERLAEAEALLRESVDMYARTIGEDNWRTARALSNLSVVKTKQGKVAEAGELLRRSVEVIRRTMGDRHPAIGGPLSNLARNYLRQERYDDAEATYREAIAMHRETFGERHVLVSHPLTGYADLCAETGRFEEAEAAVTEGLELREEAYGASHSLVVETKMQLGDILAQAGRGESAVATLRAAVDDARAGGPDARTVLASVLVKLEEHGRTLLAAEERRDILAEALRIRREEYGDDDSRCVELEARLASLR